VVTAAEATAQAAGDRAQQVATATATAAVSQSITSSETSFSSSGTQASSSASRSSLAAVTVQQQQTSSILQNSQSFTAVSNQQQTTQLQLLVPTTVEQAQTTQTTAVFAPQELARQESEQLFQQPNFLTDLNSPLKQILEAQQVQQSEPEQPQQTQRNQTATNELATGVGLAQLATIPQGYASYTNFALRDANFYEPREVYKNQRVVDNVRVLRGLGSDQKHQDLVNLQYK
jgi:uncharacterized membrane protein